MNSCNVTGAGNKSKRAQKSGTQRWWVSADSRARSFGGVDRAGRELGKLFGVGARCIHVLGRFDYVRQ